MAAAISTVADELTTAASQPLCFGIEVDVRLLSSPSPSSSSSPAAVTIESLVLAHDSFAAGVAPLLADNDDGNAERASEGEEAAERHLSFVGLIARLSRFAESATVASKGSGENPPSFTFVLKIDVKEAAALPALLDHLTDDARRFAGDGTAVVALGPSLRLAPSQVWLNMDVAPLGVPLSSPGASSYIGMHAHELSDADAALLPLFGRAAAEGFGLSFGWRIAAPFREWADRSAPEAVAAAIRKGNAAMLTFLRGVYANSSSCSSASPLLTFALNFAFFIGRPLALSALAGLIEEAAAIVTTQHSNGASPAFVFPTYWRSRSDTISATDAATLASETREATGVVCSVDRE